MKRKTVGFWPLISALVLVASLAALAYAYLQFSLVRQWEEAEALQSQQRFEEALAKYGEMGRYLGGSPLLKSHFEQEYSAARIAQLRLLYQSEKYDEAIELAESCIQERIADLGGAYFWSGNSFFQKGIHEEVGEDSFPWFRRAQAQFREGLVHDVPTRWNLRFNYEFVKMAIEQAGKDQNKEPIKIMRPQDPLRQPARKIEG